MARGYENAMKQGTVLVFLGLVVLGASLLAFPQTRTFTGTITITIPPALELLLPSESLDLHLAPGTSAIRTVKLSVGTNDWPLELHFALLSSCFETGLAFEYRLEAEKEGQITRSWIQIPAISLSTPVLLPFPSWTDYTLSIRATAQENAVPGTCFQSLRMILRSASGLIEIQDIPISVTVLAGASAGSVRAEGQGGTSHPVDANALASGETGGAPLPERRQVLIITWEGITQVNCDDLPIAD